MILRDDILSMEYLKKTEFTGCHQGMRYRLEGVTVGDAAGGDAAVGGEKKLRCTVWPEPFNFFQTPESEKESEDFFFDEDGVADAVAWMNDRFFQEKDRWERAGENWDSYQ